jgi:hypothetical protein
MSGWQTDATTVPAENNDSKVLKLQYKQEGSMIGDLDGIPSGHPPKIARVTSECQES